MLTKTYCAANRGLQPVEIAIETNIAEKGFPSFNLVGLPSKSIEEAKERVKTALVNSDVDFPLAKITVNLAPADIPKEGCGYDLPLAVGLLGAMGIVRLSEEKAYFCGELSLDGKVRHTRGVFLLALLAKENEVKNIYVPRESAAEAAVVEGLTVYPIDDLKSLIRHLKKEKIIQPLNNIKKYSDEIVGECDYDFCEICGQEQAKRTLEIAAAGGHNVMLRGSPGTGKTMLSRAMSGILPNLNKEESLEVTKIYSITGNIPVGGSLIRQRPYRAPHHTTSTVGLIGGGSTPKPGEVTLAHRGVLFLDELPEFSHSSLEALRQPMEDGMVSISRAAGSITYPAQFILIAACNPCPCGYLLDESKKCQCSHYQISRYNRKISGPILDRFDMHLNVPVVPVKEITTHDVTMNENSISIRKRVTMARKIQEERFRNVNKVHTNADMKNKHIKELGNVSNEVQILLNRAANKFNFSTRAYFRLIKVARTIADLDSEIIIGEKHMAEALQYRNKEDEQ